MLPVVARSILSKIAPDVIVKAENNRAAALRQLAVRDTYGALRQSVWDRDDDIEENWERSASLGDMLEAALKGDYIEDVIEDLRLGREPRRRSPRNITQIADNVVQMPAAPRGGGNV